MARTEFIEVFRAGRSGRWLWRCLVCPVQLDNDQAPAVPSGASRWWAAAMWAAAQHAAADRKAARRG